MLLTPTPTQFFFPKEVTEEQEAYVQGFAHALEEIYKRQGPPATVNQEEEPQESQLDVNFQYPVTSNVGTVGPPCSVSDNFMVLPNVAGKFSQPTGIVHNVNPINNLAGIRNQMQSFVGNSMPHFPAQPMNFLPLHRPAPAVYQNQIPQNSYSSFIPNTSVNPVIPITTSNLPFVPLDSKLLNPNVAISSAAQSFQSNHQLNSNSWSMPFCDVKSRQMMPTVESSLNGTASVGSPRSSCDSDYMVTQMLNAVPSAVNMDDQERLKLERKRAKNRVAAQKCQMRKVERISKLEDKAEQLREQNA